jgi:hypothetical protein
MQPKLYWAEYQVPVLSMAISGASKRVAQAGHQPGEGLASPMNSSAWAGLTTGWSNEGFNPNTGNEKFFPRFWTLGGSGVEVATSLRTASRYFTAGVAAQFGWSSSAAVAPAVKATNGAPILRKTSIRITRIQRRMSHPPHNANTYLRQHVYFQFN